MTFPATQAPVTVEIAPGGDPADDTTWSWTDVTSSVRVADGITIEGGRRDEGTHVDPTVCRMVIDNRSGDFSPRNPQGQWYGHLSRNTPLRVRWTADTDTFTTDVAGGWGTTSNGNTWATFGSVGTVDAADFEVSGGEAAHYVEAADAYRGTYLTGLSLLDVEVAVTARCDLAAVTGAAVTLAGVMLRVQDGTNYFLAQLSVATSGTVAVQFYYVIDGTPSLYSSTTVTGISLTDQPYRFKARAVGSIIQAKAWPAGDTEPTGWHAAADDGGVFTTAGSIGIRSGLAAGNTNAKPVAFYYDDLAVTVDRFVGYVTEWPARWDVTGNNAYVAVEAAGVLRRLQQGAAPLLSSLRRKIPTLSPVAYWPLEDKPGTTSAGSPTAGVEAMTVAGFTFEADSDLTGSAPLPSTTVGSTFSGTVPTWTGTPTQWEVAFAYRADTPANTNTVMQVQTSGTIRRWHIRLAPTSVVLLGYDRDDVLQINTSPGLVANFYGPWAFLHLYVTESGTSLNYTLRWRGVDGTTSTMVSATRAATTAGAVRRVYLNPRGSGADDVALGHISVWNMAALGFNSGYDHAYNGFTGEAAQPRISRLCAENSVSYVDIGDTDDDETPDMGPQRVTSLLEALREAEAADGGTLFELDGGLAYVTRADRYNPPVWMAIDVDAGQFDGLPEPADDDQQLVNDMTITRPDGSFARHVDQASVDSVGTYAAEADANVETDELLPNIAAWRVHLGTADEMRWPRLPLNLARNPALIDTWLSHRPGSRLTADHTITQIPGVPIDVLADGWSETIEPYMWRVELNCVPASPWNVATLDDEVLGRLDTAGSELAGAVDGDDTTLTVATTAGPTWTEDPAEFPLDITIGGEEMSVTNIGPTLDDTFTRSVSNGWGTADTGQAWTTSGGAAADYATNGTLGFVTHSVDNTRKFVTTGSFQDVQLLSQMKISATPSGANVIGGLVARYVDDNNAYHCWLVFTTTDGIHLTIAKRVASTFTTLESVQLGGTYAAGTFMWIRFAVAGSLLQAKTWQDGNREPDSFRLTTTDTSFTAAGAVGTHSVLLTGNTSFPTFSWDNLTTVTPQTFTVTRSTNGVTKPHAAEADVRLAQPMTLAL